MTEKEESMENERDIKIKGKRQKKKKRRKRKGRDKSLKKTFIHTMALTVSKKNKIKKMPTMRIYLK
jgi:hypothetical protein